MAENRLEELHSMIKERVQSECGLDVGFDTDYCKEFKKEHPNSDCEGCKLRLGCVKFFAIKGLCYSAEFLVKDYSELEERIFAADTTEEVRIVLEEMQLILDRQIQFSDKF